MNARQSKIDLYGNLLDGRRLQRAFARIAPFKQDHNVVSGLDHPTLQLHQFALQAQQFAEIEVPQGLLAAVLDVIIKQGIQVMPSSDNSSSTSSK